jgi:hypothetical protein
MCCGVQRAGEPRSEIAVELVDRNPFRGLGRRGKGRAEMAPPTEAELSQLLEAGAVHGE